MVSAQMPMTMATWLTQHAKTRPQGGTVSQVIREAVVALMERHGQPPVESPVEIPTTKELRQIAALKRGGAR